MEKVAIHADDAKHAETFLFHHRPYRLKLSVRPFLGKGATWLRPMATGTWEKLQAILDSGASFCVSPLNVCREYPAVLGEVGLAGVRDEIADGNDIPNLGETLMPVVTV